MLLDSYDMRHARICSVRRKALDVQSCIFRAKGFVACIESDHEASLSFCWKTERVVSRYSHRPDSTVLVMAPSKNALVRVESSAYGTDAASSRNLHLRPSALSSAHEILALPRGWTSFSMDHSIIETQSGFRNLLGARGKTISENLLR